MALIKVSSFVRLVPEAARNLLPAELSSYQVFLMPWLSQLYYDDKLIHYELVKLPPRFSNSRLELGLHFESKNHMLNTQLLEGFDRYLYEVREALGDNWYAEPWDRGWTKIYTTVDYVQMDEELADRVARQMAAAIGVLQPMYHLIHSSLKKRSA